MCIHLKARKLRRSRVLGCKSGGYMTSVVVDVYRFIDFHAPDLPIIVSFLLLDVVSLRNVYIEQDCCV